MNHFILVSLKIQGEQIPRDCYRRRGAFQTLENRRPDHQEPLCPQPDGRAPAHEGRPPQRPDNRVPHHSGPRRRRAADHRWRRGHRAWEPGGTIPAPDALRPRRIPSGPAAHGRCRARARSIRPDLPQFRRHGCAGQGPAHKGCEPEARSHGRTAPAARFLHSRRQNEPDAGGDHQGGNP